MSMSIAKPLSGRRCSKRTGAVRKIAGPAAKFPGKLHALLDYVEREGLEHVISWIRDGTAFKVHDPEKLVDRVLPIFFGQTMYRSFQRQLSMWHFHKICIGFDRGAFLHPYFKRGDKTLCAKMSRNISDQPHSLLLEDDQLLLDFEVLGTDIVNVENPSTGDLGQDSVDCHPGTRSSSIIINKSFVDTAALLGPVTSSCPLTIDGALNSSNGSPLEDRTSFSDLAWDRNGNKLQSELVSILSLLEERPNSPLDKDGLGTPSGIHDEIMVNSIYNDWSMPRPIEYMMGQVIPPIRGNVRNVRELTESKSNPAVGCDDTWLEEDDSTFDLGKFPW